MNDYLDLLETARSDDKHADAVLWKFCDLDVDPEDRYSDILSHIAVTKYPQLELFNSFEVFDYLYEKYFHSYR